MMFGLPPWPVTGSPAGRKLSCAMLQPTASLRPVITNRSWTLPSAVPSGCCLKRASRIGPAAVMNQGTTFFAPVRVATAISGLEAGLVPPGPGCKWQPRHWFELKRGPRPLWSAPVTVLTSAKRVRPSLKNVVSSAARPFSGPPAPAAPPRTPGSTALDCTGPISEHPASIRDIRTMGAPVRRTIHTARFAFSIVAPPESAAPFEVVAHGAEVCASARESTVARSAYPIRLLRLRVEHALGVKVDDAGGGAYRPGMEEQVEKHVALKPVEKEPQKSLYPEGRVGIHEPSARILTLPAEIVGDGMTRGQPVCGMHRNRATPARVAAGKAASLGIDPLPSVTPMKVDNHSSSDVAEQRREHNNHERCPRGVYGQVGGLPLRQSGERAAT